VSRFMPIWILLCTAGVLALAACGGGGTEEVNGCKIEPNTVCQGADLSDSDLSGEDLTGANLSGANLTDVDLSDANLTEANLTNARIIDANLDNANLTRTNLEGATIENTALAGTTRCGTIRTNGTIDDTSCPASGGTTTTTTTTTATTTAAAPQILSWTGPSSANCKADTETVTLRFRWRTSNAEAIDFEVDGMPPGATAGAGPNGSIGLPFDCGETSHTYTLTASNAAGDTVTKELTVESE
jgi:hypothetical protein